MSSATWPDVPDPPPPTLREMLDFICAFAQAPPRDQDPLWQQVCAHACFCRDNWPHGYHQDTCDAVLAQQVMFVWAEIVRRGPEADVAFCLSEMNHAGGGL